MMNQSNKGKEKSVTSPETTKKQQPQQGEKVISGEKSTHPKQMNGSMRTPSTKPSMTEDNQAADTTVPGTNDQVSSKGNSMEEALSSKGKSGSDTTHKQVIQGDLNDQSNKKMTTEEWGSRFVHIHQERKVKKAREQGFTRPESLKDKLIREGKSHPNPRDPKFPQFFKERAIKVPSQEQEMDTSGDNIGENWNDATKTPPTAIPYSEATPK
jgi:hypothetical protein